MPSNINGTSNLGAATREEYPSGLNGQNFSIDGGFRFSLTFDTTDAAENGRYCLIQLVTASNRVLENANYRQTSDFAHYPVLDGDVMAAANLWYSHTTVIDVAAVGNHSIELPDDPATSPADGFYGAPTGLNVNEAFLIIFAEVRPDGSYHQIQQWSWGYSDQSTKVDNAWPAGNFQSDFRGAQVDVDLSQFDGSRRANNESRTVVERK